MRKKAHCCTSIHRLDQQGEDLRELENTKNFEQNSFFGSKSRIFVFFFNQMFLALDQNIESGLIMGPVKGPKTLYCLKNKNMRTIYFGVTIARI